MKLKDKSWIWWFTFPFAHNNFTTVRDTIYCPKGSKPTKGILAHEMIHSKQQEAVGFWTFAFLYLFCLPFLWNPWRKKWEYQAYRNGSGLGDKQTKKILRSVSYGCLL